MKKFKKASTVQRAVLEELQIAWELHPDPKDVFPAVQIIQRVVKRLKNKVDNILIQAAINNLSQSKLIAIYDMDGNAAIRITDEGRNKLSELKYGIRTRLLSLIGAITGILALLINFIDKVLNP